MKILFNKFLLVFILGFLSLVCPSFARELASEPALQGFESQSRSIEESKVELQQDQNVEKVIIKKGGSVDQTQVESKTIRSYRTVTGMTAQAVRVFDFLNEGQKIKAVHPHNSQKRDRWSFHPSPRLLPGFLLPEHSGISIMDLSADQRLQLSHLLDTVLTVRGLEAVHAAVQAEKDDSTETRGFWNKLIYKYGPENFYLTFFGSPRDSEWGWRFEGHMISLNFTIRAGQPIEMNPVFLGTTQGQIQLSNGRNAEILKPVVQEIRNWTLGADRFQEEVARSGLGKAPKKLEYATGIFGRQPRIKSLGRGLPYSTLSVTQKNQIIRILESYQAHFETPLRTANLNRVRASLSKTEIFFLGDARLEQPFYMRIQSPQFVFEFLSEERQSDQYQSLWINL